MHGAKSRIKLVVAGRTRRECCGGVLNLALVKQLLGEDFRYAVLDDVVMSVDSSHRRRFAELLKTEFPNVQFVITTHDEVWGPGRCAQPDW
jgi:predicted ATP-binding protein involved in virulence